MLKQFISPIFILKTVSRERERERERERDSREPRERKMGREIQREIYIAIPFICTHPVEYEINDDCHLYRHKD